MEITGPRATRILTNAVAVLLAVLSAAVLPSAPVAAQQQNEIILSVDFDGTASFADPLDDGSGNGVHSPGEDGGANNNVVRTNDQIQYRIDWNVNEVDGSAVTIRMSLPEGVTWMEDPSTSTGIPAGCASGSNTGNDGRDLVCITDDEHEGSDGAIHPRALVGALLDGDKLNVTASVESGESGPTDSNPIETTVSARPKADWIKGKVIKDSVSGDVIGYEPNEIIWGIDNGGVTGRIFVWNLFLIPSGGLKGAEPLNDSIPIQYFDHMYLATPDAVLATGLMPPGRSACGGYDGTGGFPLGTAGLGTPAQTTAGTWSCTDLTAGTGYGYPVVQVDITGQDTSNPPAQNADFSGNGNVLLSGQIAFWMSDAELEAMAVPRIIANGITGSDAEVVSGGDITPIEVAGTGGPVDEVDFGLNNASPYEFPSKPTTSSPGRSYRHHVRYQNGPYQEWQGEDPNTGIVYRGMDRRHSTTYGGTGYTITDGANGANGGQYWRWDGDGQTPRGNVMTVVADFSTVTSRGPAPNTYLETLHGCVALDPTHQELIPFASSYDYFDVDPHPTLPSLVFNRATIGGGVGTPTSPLAHVLAGSAGTTATTYWPGYQSGVAINQGDIDYVVEFAAGAVTPTNAVAQHGVTCNEDDADDREWVDSNGDLSVFETGALADGTPVYGDITHVRIRGLEPVPWHSLSSRGVSSWGSSYQLSLQVRAKDDPAVQVADQELFVYSSRATGVWDGVGQPPTASCTNGTKFTGGSDTDIPGGWCNLAFTDDGTDSNDITDFKNDYDATVSEYTDSAARPRMNHADVVYIVEPALGISKKNLDGPSDIVVNGDTVEFVVRPAVTGSSLDSIADIVVTDPLSGNYQFVGFTQLPSTPGATCAPSGAGFSCSFGTHPGGWSDEIRYEVIVKDAGANATLKNTATVRGNDSNTGEPKAPATSSAFSYTPAPFEESGIVKVLPGHLGACPTHPTDDPPPAGWSDRCETIAADSGIVFELLIENEGNVDLENYRIIDVLPFNGDTVEPASATGVVGDGRTPPSTFTGTLDFVAAFGAAGANYLYSADPPGNISRDPEVSESANTWCTTAAGGTAVFGAGACPASPDEVTAVYVDLGTVPKGGTRTVTLQLDTADNTCGDLYTNNFGGRTDGLKLPVRSNDVTIITAVCDPSIDIEKDTNGTQADAATEAVVVLEGQPVTWTYEVENTGSTALLDATVTDSQGVAVDCDVDGDDALDGTNVIPVLLPGQKVTCEATGVAVGGPYMNEASVNGVPASPDFGTCGCDPADPSSWPTDAASYGPIIDPVTGNPVYPDQKDDDPSHYVALVPVPAIAIEKSTNGSDADTPTGPAITVGAPVTWVYNVTNFGNTGLRDATVGDDQGVVTVCDINGDGAFDDGTNIIRFLAVGQTIACQGTGIAIDGQYSNTGTVSGTPVLPDFSDPVFDDPAVDPSDPTTWPTDPSLYDTYVDPATGETAADIDDVDPSHYFGFNPGPGIDIEKSTNAVDADTPYGPVVPVGGAITWTYLVTNTGNTALLAALVTDSDPAVTPDCDIDGDDIFDGTNVVPFLAVGASVTCQATGTATPEQYENTAGVSGDPAIPDFTTCGCNPDDSTTWPDGAKGYQPATDAAGEPLAPVEDEDDSHYFGFEPGPAIDIEKDTNGNQADVADDDLNELAGNPVTWTYVVTNTGGPALANATVTDSDPGVTPDCDVDGDEAFDGTNIIPFLAPGDSVTCQATGPAVAGTYRNEAGVSGEPVLPDFATCDCNPADASTWPEDPDSYLPATNPDGTPADPVEDADESGYFGIEPAPAVDIEKDTNGDQADSTAGPVIPVGGAVTWTYQVTNTGDVPLANATVSDSDPTVEVVCAASLGDTGGDAVIDLFLPAEIVSCTATGTALSGPYANTGSVTGEPLYAPNPTGDENPTDPNTWSTNPADYLPVIGPDGEPVDPVDDADDSHYWGAEPAVDIEKATNGDDADEPDGPLLVPGAPVTWTYVVENTGNTALTDATVTDSQGVVVDCDIDGDEALDGTNVIPLMLPTATVTCEGTGAATVGPYSNTASVTGAPATPDFDACSCDPQDPTTWPTDVADYNDVLGDDGEPVPAVADEDLSHYTGLTPEPALDLEKSTNAVDADAEPGPVLSAGDPVTWTYEVTNRGSTALAGVTVSDSTGVAVDCGDGTNVIALLLPGQVISCTATGTATSGQYSNTGSITGDPVLPDFATCDCDPTDPTTWPTDPAGYVPAPGPGGSPLPAVGDVDDSHFWGAEPGVDIEKSTNGDDADSAPGPSIEGLTDVTWTYQVTNTGNTALTAVTVSDSTGVTVDCGDGTNVIAVLNPGKVITCSATGEAIIGQYENTGSVDGTPAMPDFSVCGCDAGDPSTWPTDATGFVPVAGAEPVTDSDMSHYLGTTPVDTLAFGDDEDQKGPGSLPLSGSDALRLVSLAAVLLLGGFLLLGWRRRTAPVSNHQ